MTTGALLGIDLSPTASAAFAVPYSWDGVWSRTACITVGESLPRGTPDAARARRCETIATRVVAFARQHRVSIAYVEQYAFGRSYQAHTLGELGGVVRLELVRAGIEIFSVPASAARKLLLGKVPKLDPKAAVYAALRAAGAPITSFDEADALAVANWGLAENGSYCFTTGAV